MVVIVLAVLSAACNAASTVLERLAAATAPPATAMRLSLIGYLLKRPIWLAGIVAMVASFLLQAAALRAGALTVVQPLLITKLPLTALVALVAFRGRLHIGVRDWLTVAAMTGGLALALAVATPGSTGYSPTAAAWVVAVAVGVLVTLVTVALAARHPGAPRAALLGAASGIAFGLVAAFIKAATDVLASGTVTGTSVWPFVATAVAGAAAVVLQQNALQAGSLAASQPASTIVGTVTGVALGVLLFRENLHVGSAWPLEVVGVGLVVWSVIAAAGSPLATASLAGDSGTAVR